MGNNFIAELLRLYRYSLGDFCSCFSRVKFMTLKVNKTVLGLACAFMNVQSILTDVRAVKCDEWGRVPGVHMVRFSTSYLPPYLCDKGFLEAQGRSKAVVNSALLLTCLNAVANSLTVSTYLGLLLFLPWENRFRARWNYTNPCL